VSNSGSGPVSGPGAEPGNGAVSGGGRELAGVVAGCVAGAGLTWYAAGRAWAVEVTDRPDPLPDIEVVHTGAQVLPWLPALALVGLAGAGAVLATRGAARRLIGALLAAAGVTLAAGGLAALTGAVSPAGSAAAPTSTSAGWPAVAVLGAALLLAGGIVTMLRSPRWPAMGARYERPAAGGPGTTAGAGATRSDDPSAGAGATGSTDQPAGAGAGGAVEAAGPQSTLDAWNALDRGEDPTTDDRPGA
jgi:uncharacterized membrane protein (TIGR02234 family)